MTNEEMALILEQFENGYPVEVSRDEAQALRAGAAALRAGEWKPIKDAPKDGQSILIFVPPFEEFPGYSIVSHWYRANGRNRGYWWNAAHTKPTHYRDLPAPPEGV